jgi:hypothetical protein
MIMVALLAIASLARVQDVVTQLKRDREEEMIHRGAQYARAVQKFVHKFKQYPVRIEQLEDTNQIRCLRKRYKDPITGGDFRLLHQTDVNAILTQGAGLFGNPAAGGGAATAGGSLTSPIAGGFLGAAGLGGQSAPGGTPPGGTPNTSSSSPSGQSSTGLSAPGSAGKSSSDSNFGSSGGAFGGGPIYGVASTSNKVSLKVFDGKNHYKDWLFIYVQALDRPGANGSIALIKGPFVRSQMTNGAFGGGTGVTNLNGNSSNNNGNSNSGNNGSGLGTPIGSTASPKSN